MSLRFRLKAIKNECHGLHPIASSVVQLRRFASEVEHELPGRFSKV